MPPAHSSFLLMGVLKDKRNGHQIKEYCDEWIECNFTKSSIFMSTVYNNNNTIFSLLEFTKCF